MKTNVLFKWALAIAAVLFLGYLADRVYQEWRGVRVELGALKAADEKAQAVISQKDAENKALTAENATLKAKDSASAEREARLRTESAAKDEENARLREELKTAPPETLLVKTQGWLSTQDIWLRANAASQVEAVFSLSTFRLNADALARGQYVEFTLVPSLQEQLEESHAQNAYKSAVIVNDKKLLDGKDVVIGVMNEQIVTRDNVISSIKKLNLWREVRDFGLGFLAATILDMIFGK